MKKIEEHVKSFSKFRKENQINEGPRIKSGNSQEINNAIEHLKYFRQEFFGHLDDLQVFHNIDETIERIKSLKEFGKTIENLTNKDILSKVKLFMSDAFKQMELDLEIDEGKNLLELMFHNRKYTPTALRIIIDANLNAMDKFILDKIRWDLKLFNTGERLYIWVK